MSSMPEILLTKRSCKEHPHLSAYLPVFIHKPKPRCCALSSCRALLLDKMLLAFIGKCPNGVSMAGGSSVLVPAPGKPLLAGGARGQTWCSDLVMRLNG